MAPSKLLIVDDEVTVERLIRQRFRKEIQSGEFVFLFAFDGTEAVDVLKENPDIDVVITDINMPKMDGLTLLNHIQELSPITKTIMISAYGDLDNIRASMNRGAFDFVTKPIDFEDLRRTMQKTLQFVDDIKAALKNSKENQLLKMYVNPSVIGYLAGINGGGARIIATSDSILSKNADPPTAAAAERRQTDSGYDPGERIDGTVCFIDVCGFTSISEQASPETITKLLNTYFDHIAETALEYRGTIDKFLGDAAMVVFTGPEHLERAAACCIAARARIQSLLGTELTAGLLHPDISIGMNTGEMVSGSFGSNRIKRLDYTVIGDTVNTAARLEGISKPGDILVSHSVYEKLADRFAMHEIGEVRLRNKSNPVRVYNLLSTAEILR